jgi:hypothetical protein
MSDSVVAPQGVVAALMFVVSALVVSLDVCGLTMSKGPELASRDKSGVWRWAGLNAAWHAILLFAYSVIIHLGIDFVSFRLPDWVAYVVEAIASFARAVGLGWLVNFELVDPVIQLLKAHLRLILGGATLVVVWRVYSAKVVGSPHMGKPSELGGLATTIYGILVLGTRIVRPRQFSAGSVQAMLTSNLQAALVAIDMLALAALLKVMGYLGSIGTSASISLVVLAIVFLMALLSALFARSVFSPLAATSMNPSPSLGSKVDGTEPGARIESPPHLVWLMTAMRITEPLLIFYFAIELVAFIVFGDRIHSCGFFFGALAFVVALCVKHKLAVIVSKSAELADSGPGDSQLRSEIQEEIAAITLWSVLAPLVKLACWVSLLSVVIVAALVAIATMRRWWHPDINLSLDALISDGAWWICLFVALCSLLAVFGNKYSRRPGWMYWPLRKARLVESRAVDALAGCMKSRGTLLWCTIALFVAAIVPIYEQLADSAFDVLAGEEAWAQTLNKVGLRSNHLHGLQVATWMILSLAIALMLWALDDNWGIVKKAETSVAPALRSMLVGTVSTIMLFALPHVGFWFDALEDRGFRMARAEQTLSRLSAFERENGDRQMTEQDVENALAEISLLSDGWGRVMKAESERVRDGWIVSITSAGESLVTDLDDIVRHVFLKRREH